MNSRWLLIAVPLAFGLTWRDAAAPAVFAAALVAIIPLVGMIGSATERLASRLGPTLGGLFNSTLNNLPELLISGFRRGAPAPVATRPAARCGA